MKVFFLLGAFLVGTAYAVELKNHEYYANLRHLQKNEKMIEHDHEYYANLRHLQHENNFVQPQDHEYYSNLRHLNHEDEYKVHDMKSHEYYANLHHLNHDGEDQRPQLNHEYYSNLHHLDHDHEGMPASEPRQLKDHTYYSRLHHLRHEDRDHEYYHHMHKLHRHHLRRFHGCNDDYHVHRHRSHSLFWLLMPFRLMCAADECVPDAVKAKIVQGWTKTGQDIWNDCNNNGQCTQEQMPEILKCMGRRLILNKTDITVQEYRDTWKSWSVIGLGDCCENDITLKMMKCSKPTHRFHHHRHHNRYYHRRHHHSYGGMCGRRHEIPHEDPRPEINDDNSTPEPRDPETITEETVKEEYEEEHDDYEPEEPHPHNNALHHYQRLNHI